jgi:NitT/TauT family transport system substrate-binding protein
VTAAFITSGVIQMRQKGLELNLIWPGEYGVHFYSDTLITNQHMIETRSQLVARFLRASLKGWREAIGNPEAAVQMTLKYARVPDPAFQAAMLEALMPLVHTGEHQIGWMTGEAWRRMTKDLMEQGLISSALDYDKSYSMRFLEDVYGVPAQ